MTHRLLLASRQQPVVTPEPNPTQVGFPETSDLRIKALRPTSRRLAVLALNLDQPQSSTNFHSLGAAIDKAKDIQFRDGLQGKLNWNIYPGYDIGPDYRVDIFVSPGHYNESFGSSSYVNIISTTGIPGDVVFSSSDEGGGVAHTYGACYWEGLRFIALSPVGHDRGQKYPLHLTHARDTEVFVNCDFWSENVDADGQHMALGMDGGSNSTAHFYKCSFKVPSGTPAMTNMHGAPGSTEPCRLIYEDCPTLTEPGYGSFEPAAGDELWVIGSTPKDTIITTGQVQVHTSGDPGTLEALSAWERVFYYPSSIGAPTKAEYVANDIVDFQPVVGRRYFVPIPIKTAIHMTHLGCNISTSGGDVQLQFYRSWQGKPLLSGTSESDGVMASPAYSVVVAQPVSEVSPYYLATFYPGETLWLSLKFSDASVRINGSRTIGSDLPCYYSDDDGTSLTQVQDGSLFPVAYVRSVF